MEPVVSSAGFQCSRFLLSAEKVFRAFALLVGRHVLSDAGVIRVERESYIALL